MQINDTQISYSLKQIDTEVQFNLKGFNQNLLPYFSSATIQKWIPELCRQTYTLIINGFQWTFRSRYVLGDNDHSSLIQSVKTQLASYLVFRIIFSPQDHERFLKRQLKAIQEHICGQTTEQHSQGRNGQSAIVFLTKLLQKETIHAKLANLRQFHFQKLFYPLDQYLMKMKLNYEESYQLVIGLMHHFQGKIKSYALSRLKKMGLEDEILIKRIRNIKKDQQDIPHKFKRGIIIQLIGLGRVFGKLYQILERWLEKLNWLVVEVFKIQCCSKDRLVQWYKQNHRQRVYHLSSNQEVQRIVIFSPKHNKQYFEKQLRVASRIVTAREFGELFGLVYKFKTQFRKFIAGENVGEANLKIFQHFISFQGEPNVEERFICKVREFIELYNQEKVQITHFNSEFQVSLLKNFYAKDIQTKPTTLQAVGNKIYRVNPKKLSEKVEMQLKEIHQKMCRQLVQKPLARNLPKKIDYFNVKEAPEQWKNPQSLQSRRYEIQDKLIINLRSYETITNSKSSCVFFVNQFDKCSELKKLMQLQGGNGLSQNFMQNVIKNVSISSHLKLSKYFERIYVCCLQQKRNGYKFQNRQFQQKFKQFMEAIIEESNETNELKIMFPREFRHIDYVVPAILQNVLLSVKYKPHLKKKIFLYTSCQDADRLTKNIVDCLKNFKFQGQKVERVSDLDLKIPEMEKIIEYKYFQLKYFENEANKTATPMNSFIFYKQFKKRTKTPIFLLSRQQIAKSKFKEYLVICHNWQVYEVQKDQIIRLRQKCSQYGGLYRLCSIVKKYFSYIDCLVVYGDIQTNVFSYKFAYTDTSQRLYKRFEEIKIVQKQQKIIVISNSNPTQYELVTNQYLKLYRVETHPSKLQELRQLKRCHSLE